MQMPEIKKGEYLLIAVDGTETVIQQKPNVGAICKAINSEFIDTVTLKRNPRIVMMVDDTGFLDGKPTNSKAIALYHSICKPGTVWPICGDVAIANDTDFA